MKILKFYIALAAVALLPLTLTAQAPTDYYNDAQSKNGATLKTALHNKIKGHTVRSYGNLWTDFQSTDKRTDGKVWDMYSTCDFTFVTQQCGSYSNIGDCYNREHSFPKSWFNDASPMYTDLFHLYPTDGKTNGMRSNYPFGEVGTTTWSGNNGSKLGNAAASLGYTGLVFEPDNEYKGDFARSYFYMVTRYEDVLTSWSTPHLDGTAYPAFSTWTTTMLLKWHRQDPVSEKEQNRNNAVFQIQKNRNPFIDHPELAEYVWGDSLTLNLKWGEVSNNPTPNDPTTPEAPCSVTIFDTVTVNIFDTVPSTMFEDFETMTGNGAYTGKELTLETGAWFTKGYTTMDDNDRRNGERSVRLRGRDDDVEHRIQMEFDKSNGIGTVTFSYGSYRTHSGGQVKVQVSTDQGATWRDCGEIITAPAWSGNMQTATVEVHQKGNARIRILKLSTAGSSSVNIDDISITDYCACSKVITFDTISVFDTVTVNVFDTITVKIFDTVTVNVFDTISVFDTVTVKIFDTVTVNVFDTTTIKVFDTVRVTVYDTVQVSPNPTATVKVKQGSFSVYPNPAANGQLTVDNEQWKEGEAVEIYSMSGALTAAYKTTGRKTSISISALPNGAYLLRVGSYTAKVVKQ